MDNVEPSAGDLQHSRNRDNVKSTTLLVIINIMKNPTALSMNIVEHLFLFVIFALNVGMYLFYETQLLALS